MSWVLCLYLRLHVAVALSVSRAATPECAEDQIAGYDRNRSPEQLVSDPILMTGPDRAKGGTPMELFRPCGAHA